MTLLIDSPLDAERRVALVRMKRTATGLLGVMAVIFCISFALQDDIHWLAWVRAASEGGMVGAIADWFAVTALFRHPLGLKIPHTAIIPRRKNEIGASLGEFVESNFLSTTVVREKLESVAIGRTVGAWLARPENATRLSDDAAAAARSTLELLDDNDVQDVVEQLARTHIIDPSWSEHLGAWGERLVADGGHQNAVNLLLDGLEEWLTTNPAAFSRLVSARLPGWLPSFVDRLVDERIYREAVEFVHRMRTDDQHTARVALDRYLAELTHKLQDDPETIAAFERVKSEMFDSPRVRDLASRAWNTTREALIASLEDPESGLRRQLTATLMDIGERLGRDDRLTDKVDDWVTDAAVALVDKHRHEIAGVITETIERWDPKETSDKIELQVGKDLQFIRINGTVVGALAGLVIFTVATTVFGG
ncbi:DUF445 domain-containing protein [Mycetocola manganoxydans]|uniref:DUF445 domain-containing protein n=1 Tax=Mycetocola manganoxydans TaxID=699879 RepID=A0A3L6ZYD8_9MICO|nr:DUF445 domain-containing protein [Mycetocola manganoxydans]RLP72152.1 DUF445 domain-containing protein [Mycetocola manganoxydans]GHD52276.1 membrane protein [Mycetocola manganoxydans]